MVMNGSRSGLLPDPDSLSFSISNDGCVQDLPEPQGPAGPPAVTALYFGDGIIGSYGDAGCQPDPCHLPFRLLLSLFAGHKYKGVVASWHLDVLVPVRQFSLANGSRVCQVAKMTRRRSWPPGQAERGERKGAKQGENACRPAQPGLEAERRRRGRTWPLQSWVRCRGQRNKRSFQPGRLLSQRANRSGRSGAPGPWRPRSRSGSGSLKGKADERVLTHDPPRIYN
jgi:hypothetical protein